MPLIEYLQAEWVSGRKGKTIPIDREDRFFAPCLFQRRARQARSAIGCRAVSRHIIMSGYAANAGAFVETHILDNLWSRVRCRSARRNTNPPWSGVCRTRYA